ncbi:alpha-L-arabinofuranosidase C-terminal domain-containing protein [Armatimonas rosea]|uniref:non-reducing end alpha-L-arabinofuranosidase n=1 Tax=Armatimonas rosea TaxID=685828 RepID=A0A7W9SRG3_ARMRO|nr:alpha-L-arabinofuranosidase C-terminal domain-containing protein [Armatimonas rosea]MBB6051455.1 alpha-L-arabinofuranosidase [Armatimonas rosea]
MTNLSLLPCLALALLGAQAAPETKPTARIQIDLSAPSKPVSPNLYGIFLEEINHAFDGGLYGELVQNRSFEEGVPPPGMTMIPKPDGTFKMELASLPAGVPKAKWEMPWPWNGNSVWDPKRALIGWSLHNAGGSTGTMQLTEANPMNAASSRSLELTVQKPGVALHNSGYWGIAVKASSAYALRYFVRPGTFRGTIRTELVAESGQVLSSAVSAAVTPGTVWREVMGSLKASATDPKAQLRLRFEGTGTLQLDWVSLFPPTWKSQPNGLRPDLAQYLAGLQPSFIRFPGGCYVEGLSWEMAPDWRKTLGQPTERPGMWGYWQYRSSDGFGFHEYLQLCETLKADALYVAFAGMTVHPENNWPLEKIDPVVQQTLDAIEYAIGPTTSKWGALRAKRGHPKPFPLKYVEIGNEHPPALYGDYYAVFRKAIKAKYPQIQVVMSMFWSGLNQPAINRVGDANIDIVDEHAYRGSGWARSSFDYFDRYPRKGWGIYMGEYAHNQRADFSAALDDSLFLMMMERNGDLVKMASYAPLLANVNKRDWGVNLIEFDSSRSFAHASYYVQKLFRENHPDRSVKTVVTTRPPPDPKAPLMAGKVGLGSWDTSVEFKELRVYDGAGALVHSDNFVDLSAFEAPQSGAWSVKNGVLQQTDQRTSPAMLLLKRPLTTGKLTVKARRVDGREGFLLFFNAENRERFLFGNYGANGNEFSAIQERGVPDDCAFRGGRSTPGGMEKGRWYELSLVFTENRAELFLDGKKVSDARMERLPSFFATAGLRQKESTVIVKATNYSAQPQETELVIEGAMVGEGSGRHAIYQASALSDDNSLEHPTKLVPRETVFPVAGNRIKLTLPAYSVSVVRVPVRGLPSP